MKILEKKWSPGSAPYKDRIDALRYLHNKGCKTWVVLNHIQLQTLLNKICKIF